jgi:hypothetical protein
MKRAAGKISKSWAPTVPRLILLSETALTSPDGWRASWERR